MGIWKLKVDTFGFWKRKESKNSITTPLLRTWGGLYCPHCARSVIRSHPCPEQFLMTASPKFSAFLPCYRGVLGKKEQLKQPFLSALHAQGVHWLQTWDISQNKQERVVLMVFVSMTRWCFTENRTVKERLRPTALHPVTLPVEVLPKWGHGRPTTSLKMVCEYCY